jgi:YfiH family protein
VAVAGQVHGVHVARVEAEDRGRGARTRDSLLPPADGLVSAAPGVALLGCFADCVPLLLADPARLAVGMAHAGWRGTVADMAGAAVRAMEELLGSRPVDLIAVVGPSIGPCCYEVGEEVIAAARGSYHDELGEVGLVRGGRLYFDLWRANELALRRAGVERVVRTNLCTACDTTRFFSHRAEGGATGRFSALIGIRG